MDKLKTIKKAREYFEQENYEKSLFLYSQILFAEPDNPLWQMLVQLCDMGLENSANAQRIYNYFITLTSEKIDRQTAIDKTNDLIRANDGDIEQISRYLKEFSKNSIDKLESISYLEFSDLVAQRGSFRVAFEDIMYSTKIALSDKEQFYLFLEQLITNDFDDMAYEYLDSHYNFFKYDDNVAKLYNMLEKKNHATATR